MVRLETTFSVCFWVKKKLLANKKNFINNLYVDIKPLVMAVTNNLTKQNKS